MFVPSSVLDALFQPKWENAIGKEMKALKKNETWDLVELPRRKQMVGYKWVFTVKYEVDGFFERCKVRLVS